MKQGDVGTELVFTVKDKQGEIVDLTNASSVKLIFKLGDARQEKDTEFVDRASGKVKYVVVNGDLATFGGMRMDVKVIFPDKLWTSETIQADVEAAL